MRGDNVRGNSKIRTEHKYEILNYIRKYGPISRTDIYEKTNISKPTVTRVIEELLKEKLILETGAVESTVGRRPVYIELNPDAYYCIGFNISRNSVSASMVNLAMEVIHKKTLNIKGYSNVEDFENIVASTIKELIAESKIHEEKILGIGIGTPGVVDHEKGIVLDFAIAHKLMNIHLKEYVEECFNLKVYVDNNANTRVLGEFWYGYGVGRKDIIYIICSEGIGSGIISNGSILRGKNNISSSLGHMTINIDGRKCSCGRFGCVEAYSSSEAIENIVKEALKRGRKSSILEICNNDIECVDYKTVCKCAEDKDPLCIEVLEEAACVLGTALSNMLGIFNPELMILSGNLFDVCPGFYDQVKTVTLQKIFSPLAGEVEFAHRRTKDSLYEIGAAAMVFKDFFKSN